jgi:DNA repair exonuclease SbcCD ATPase subunit
MSNEKYVNYYIEILTSTMHDAVVRNISLQTNAKITEEAVKEIVSDNEKFKGEISNLQNIIVDLNRQIEEFNIMKKDFEETKYQIQHLNTFRTDLVASRQENQGLQTTIQELEQELDQFRNPKRNRKSKTIVQPQPVIKEEPVKIEVVEEIKKPEPIKLGKILSTKDIFKNGGK